MALPNLAGFFIFHIFSGVFASFRFSRAEIYDSFETRKNSFLIRRKTTLRDSAKLRCSVISAHMALRIIEPRNSARSDHRANVSTFQFSSPFVISPHPQVAVVQRFPIQISQISTFLYSPLPSG